MKSNIWMQSQKQQNDLCSFPRQVIQYHSNTSLCPMVMPKKLNLNDPMKTEMQYLDAISKTTEWSLFPRQTIKYHSNPSLCSDSNAEKAEVEWFYEDLLLELTAKIDVLFIIGDWNAKVGSQETPGVTGKFGLGWRNEAGQRLIEFCQENALVIANTLFQQYKRRLYTWTSPDDQHRNQTDYILCSQRWKSSIQSAKTRLGADCGSAHELLIAKIKQISDPSKYHWKHKSQLWAIKKDLYMR